MAECQNCGGHVTDRFERVFGANDGFVYGCFGCMQVAEVRDGIPAQPQLDATSDDSSA